MESKYDVRPVGWWLARF